MDGKILEKIKTITAKSITQGTWCPIETDDIWFCAELKNRQKYTGGVEIAYTYIWRVLCIDYVNKLVGLNNGYF